MSFSSSNVKALITVTFFYLESTILHIGIGVAEFVVKANSEIV